MSQNQIIKTDGAGQNSVRANRYAPHTLPDAILEQRASEGDRWAWEILGEREQRRHQLRTASTI